MIGVNHHTMLERQLSSAGCSTSYPANPQFGSDICLIWRGHGSRSRQGFATPRLPPRIIPGRLVPSRSIHLRCAAQQRTYRGSQSPERDPSRRSGQPHRPLGSVVANAAATSPPMARRGELHSVHPDLSTSIPDAIPSLQELEDLRSRAMQLSHLTVSRLIQEDSLRVDEAGTSSTDGSGNSSSVDVSGRGSGTGRGRSSYRSVGRDWQPAQEDAAPAQRAPAVDPLRPSPPVAPARSALSRAVPLSQPISRPPPSRGNAAGASGRKSAFAPKRQPGSSQRSAPPTMVIKSERNWRHLPSLLEELVTAGRLDSFTASTFLTHLAQLVAKAPPVSHVEMSIIERMQGTLLGSVEVWLPEYRARQISNMTWALARLGLPSGAAFVRDHLLPASYPLLPWYEPQHLSNTLWALAAIGVVPDDEWLEEYLTVAFIALQKRSLAPQHLANVLWALEQMGVMPEQEWMAAYYDCVQAAVPVANPQDCSNILSCLALMRMHHQQPATTATLTGHLAQRLQMLLAPDVAAVSTASATRAPPATPAVVMDAAVLTPTPAHSAGAGLPEPAGTFVDVSDQALANSLWALAIMELQPTEGLWEAVVATLRQRLGDPTRLAPGMHPMALTIVLWASSALGWTLPTAVTSLMYGRVRSTQMEAMEPRSLATMVWAVATAPEQQARPPPDWVAEAVAVSGRSLTHLGSQSVSNILYGLCRLGARPPTPWMCAVINHFHRNLSTEASGQSLSNVLWCLAKMGYRLNEEGMCILFGLVRSQLAAWQQHSCTVPQEQQQLQPQRGRKQQQQQHSKAVLPPPPFTSQEVSNIFYAIASMGYEIDPNDELSQLLMENARVRFGESNPQELGNLLWCLAALQIRPSQPWLDDYFAAAKARLPTFKPFDLAQTLYGAAKLRLQLQPHLPPADGTQVPSGNESATADAATASQISPSTAAAGSWASAALAAAPQLILTANAQDLCNLSWALVQLRVPVPPGSTLVAAFTSRLVSLAASCDPSQLALGVWALGKWRARPSKTQLERLEIATFRQVPSMRPHELAAMLSGFAGMGHTAPAEWLSDAVQQVAARSREFGPQEWTMVVYALARVQNDNSLTEMVLRLLPRLDRLPLPSLILISYSCGCMGPSPMCRQLVNRCLALLATGNTAAWPSGSGAIMGPGANDSLRTAGHTEAPTRKRAGSGQGFGSTSTRASGTQAPQLGVSRRGGSGVVADVAARPVAVASLTPAELSALLWSAVRVGIKVMPRDFLDQFYRCTEPRLGSLPASLVASYLWAAGRLRLWLPTRWRKLLLEQAEAQLTEMRTRELAMCMGGLMWLRMWPTSSLLRKLRSCYEAQRDQMPENVRKHADGALAVLAKRLALARERERKYGCTGASRLRWLARVWRGNMRAAAAGTTGFRGRRVSGSESMPPSRVSRSHALRMGVVRKSPARTKELSGKVDLLQSASGEQ